MEQTINTKLAVEICLDKEEYKKEVKLTVTTVATRLKCKRD